MKKNEQIDSGDHSYSVGEAASVLGVSIPTVKRMVEARSLEAFRTPGGHTRVLVQSVEGVKEQRRAQGRPVRAPSPVLQNRRERLEELTLEAQEIRARREVTEQHRKDEEEAERREAEAQSREEEAAQRQAEIELERERLGHEKAQERRLLERERAEEQARLEAEEELTEFRERWYDAAAEAVAAPKLAWQTAAQRKEVTEALEAEIDRRRPSDEPRMGAIIARSLEALVEPLRAKHNAQEGRQRLTDRALWILPSSATDTERVKATAAIREALQRFNTTTDETEMRVAAEDAIRPIRQAIERHALESKLLNWAVAELPWPSDDRDRARLRRECAEIFTELPEDAVEVEAKEALEPTVREACRIVERRKAQEQRNQRKESLIRQGVAEVARYLAELRRTDQISSEDYLDSELAADLRDAVKQELEADIAGDESAVRVRQMAREVIHSDLG